MYLILDTETSGLNYQSDKVIEIGGILARHTDKGLEYVDSFQSLVFLEGPLVDKISELTGISKFELDGAEKRHIVQTKWREFLEKAQEVRGEDVETEAITHILGHSLDFDLGFLRNESWYLPEGITEIDTLDLVKISYPDSKALNLDHISHSYPLNDLFPLLVEGLSHHRALYDTFLCAGLYNLCYKRISESNLSPDFYFRLESYLNCKLKIDLDKVPSLGKQGNKNIKNGEKTQKSENIIIYNSVKKEVSESLQSDFLDILEGYNKNNLDLGKTLDSLYQMLETRGLKTYQKIILQAWFRFLNPALLGSLHINGNLEYIFHDLIYKTIKQPLKKPTLSPGNESKQKTIWKYPETLILDNNKLTTTTFNISMLIDYLTIISDLEQDEEASKEQKYLISQLKVISTNLISQAMLLSNTNYGYFDSINHGYEAKGFESGVFELKKWLVESFTLLNEVETKSLLLIETLNYISMAKSTVDASFNYALQPQNISFTRNISFNLSQFFNDTLLESDTIKTRLSKKSFLDLYYTFCPGDIKEEARLKLESKALEYTNGNSVTEGMDSIINRLVDTQDSGKLKLVVIGKNAILKSLPAKLDTLGIDYLDLSKTGSTSKLITQINKGYKGIVVTSYKYLETILRGSLSLDADVLYHPNLFLPISQALGKLAPSGCSNYDFNLDVSNLYLEYLNGIVLDKTGENGTLYVF